MGFITLLEEHLDKSVNSVFSMITYLALHSVCFAGSYVGSSTW